MVCQEDNVPRSLQRGDIRALEYQAHYYPYRLHRKDYNGWRPIHEAVYRGDLESTQFLMEHGATIHDRIGKNDEDTGPDVLTLARQSPVVKEGHPLLEYLLSLEEGSEL